MNVAVKCTGPLGANEAETLMKGAWSEVLGELFNVDGDGAKEPSSWL